MYIYLCIYLFNSIGEYVEALPLKKKSLKFVTAVSIGGGVSFHESTCSLRNHFSSRGLEQSPWTIGWSVDHMGVAVILVTAKMMQQGQD